MFDSDHEPQLPSPSQLKYKILIKNKKIASLETDGNRFRNNNSVANNSLAKCSQATKSSVAGHGNNFGPHRNSSTSAGTMSSMGTTTSAMTTTNDDVIAVVEEEDDEFDDDLDDEDEDDLDFKSNFKHNNCSSNKNNLK